MGAFVCQMTGSSGAVPLRHVVHHLAAPQPRALDEVVRDLRLVLLRLEHRHVRRRHRRLALLPLRRDLLAQRHSTATAACVSAAAAAAAFAAVSWSRSAVASSASRFLAAFHCWSSSSTATA